MEIRPGIIIPTCNRPKLLKRAVESALRQSKKADVVVVDVYGNAPYIPGTILVRPNSRLSSGPARSFGISRLPSHVNAVTYLDDDDELLTDHVACLSSQLEKGFRWAFTKALYKYPDFETDDPEPSNTGPKRYYDPHALLSQNIAPVSCFMHTLELFDNIGGFDPKVERMEDWDIWGRMFISAGPPFFMNHITNIIHKDDDGPNRTTSNKYVYAMSCHWFEIVKARLKLMSERNRARPDAESDLLLPGKVGFVIPFHNAELYIREAFESVLGQTFQDFEVIAVNDASTDSSLKIVESFNNRKIRIFNLEKNLGVSGALNHGLLMSRSEFLARMDADDVCMPNRVEKQIDFFQHNQDVSVLGTWFYSMDSKLKNMVWENRTPLTHREIEATMKQRCCIGHPTVMMKRKVVETIGGYSEEKNALATEDYELWLRALPLFKFANLPEFLLKHRTHSDQVSNKLGGIQRENTQRLSSPVV